MADGKLSTRDRRQVKISGAEDFARVDHLKSRCDAVMVGIGTVLADDPSLTIKSEIVLYGAADKSGLRHEDEAAVTLSIAKRPGHRCRKSRGGEYDPR